VGGKAERERERDVGFGSVKRLNLETKDREKERSGLEHSLVSNCSLITFACSLHVLSSSFIPLWGTSTIFSTTFSTIFSTGGGPSLRIRWRRAFSVESEVVRESMRAVWSESRTRKEESVNMQS
jgi:hypothetical protein